MFGKTSHLCTYINELRDLNNKNILNIYHGYNDA